MSIETVAYHASRRDDVFDLLERGRGHPTDPREFDWWFDGNPVGPRTIVLAEENGLLAGVLGASFYRTMVGGRETLSALPLWAVTDEAFRGRGIFQRLNAEVERVARAAGATERWVGGGRTTSIMRLVVACGEAASVGATRVKRSRAYAVCWVRTTSLV